MPVVRNLHRWDVTPKEAVEIQKRLRSEVIVEALEKQPRYVAGCDISFDKGSETVFVGIVVVETAKLSIVDRSTLVTQVTFPYIPGLLSFRESRPLLEAWQRLTVEPDLVMIDGHGYAHPRRFGIASHFGLLIEKPTVGCAKTLLIGKFEKPGPDAGNLTELIDREEVIGVALRTRYDVSPVFVSIGHHIDLQSSIKIVMKCTKDHRIPEPIRQAHLLVNALRRGEESPKAGYQESLF